MQERCKPIIISLLGCCFATSVVAEDYDFEVGLSYGMGSADSTFVSTLNGVPTPLIGATTNSSDSDNIDLIGAWYYSGLSDSSGPKSRAAFLSRASGVVIGYSRSDESGSFDFTGGNFSAPVSGNFDLETNSLSVDLRHVWRESGWYALAGISKAELEGATSVSNGLTSSSDFDTTAYSLGIGKYLGKATTLDLSVATLDVENSNPTVIALTLSHIGSISNDWQYGADVSYAKSDTAGDGDAYALRGTLYPTTDFEFGLGYSRLESGGGFDSDTIEAFAGWFVRDHIEISARYQENLPDTPPGASVDSNEFGVGVRVRF